MDRIGVKSMSIRRIFSFPNEIKRDLLFFDKIIFPRLDGGQIDYLLNKLWLQDKELNNQEVVDFFEYNSNLFQSLMDNGLVELASTNDFEVLVSKLKGPNKDLEIMAEECVTSINGYNAYMDRMDRDYDVVIDKEIQVQEHYARIFAIMKFLTGEDNFYPVISDNNLFNRGSQKQFITHFVLEQLPVPSLDISFEELMDFKNNTEIKASYYDLISWINNIAKKDLSQSEFEDAYLSLYHNYAMQYEKFKVKRNTTRMEVLFSNGFDFLSKGLTLKWGEAVKSLFSWKKSEAELWDAERKLEGRELAYIFKANDQFAGNGE